MLIGVPHLLALGHRSCYELKPWALQTLLFEPNVDWSGDWDFGRNPSREEYTTVGFCMVTLTLVCTEAKLPGRPDDLDMEFCVPNAGDYSTWEQVERIITECRRIHEFDLDHRYAVIWRMILSILYHQQPNHLPLPSVHRLAFASIMDSPIPYRTSADSFVRCCLTSSQLATYLSGDWTGWSKDLSGYQGHTIPPPLENIHFVVSSPHPPYAANIIALVSSSTGTDGWGPFTLEGTVSVDGEIWLRKRYAEHLRGNAWSREGGLWTYRGVSTPFGISGVFEVGRGPHLYFEGYFWLWKNEWSHDWPTS